MTLFKRLPCDPCLPRGDCCLRALLQPLPLPVPEATAPWGDPVIPTPSSKPRSPRSQVGSRSQQPVTLGTIMGSPRQTLLGLIFHGKNVQNISSKREFLE